MARTNIENAKTHVNPPPDLPKLSIISGPPIPGVLAIKQQMMAPICITDMIMNSFIPFALLFLRTGIPAKLAMPTKNTTAVSTMEKKEPYENDKGKNPFS